MYREHIRCRFQIIHWPQIIPPILFFISLALIAEIVFQVAQRNCYAHLATLSQSINCLSFGENMSALFVAFGFLLLGAIAWWIDRQILPAIFFLNITNILAVGIVSTDDEIYSRIFNILLAFCIPIALHFHLYLLKISFQFYRKYLLFTSYMLATLIALPFMLWTTASQANSFLYRSNIRIMLLLTCLIIAILCVHEYSKQDIVGVRGKIRLVTFGTIFAFTPLLLLSVLPELLSGTIHVSYSLTFPGLLFSPLTYIYTLVRHRFTTLETLINRIVIYYMLVVLLAGIYLIAIPILSHSTETTIMFSKINVLLNMTLLLMLSLLYTGMRHLADWVLYGGEINYLKIQEELSAAFSLALDKKTLQQLLLQELPTMLYLEGAMLFLCNEKDVLYLAGIEGFSKLEEDTPIQLTYRPLIAYLENEASPMPAQTLARMFAKEIKEPTQRFLFSMNTVSYWMPLISGRRIQGILLLGTRKSGDYLTANDIYLLKTLVHSTGIAANNIRLIEQAAQYQQDLIKAQQQIAINREQDQRRIAYELHDNTIQQIIGINFQLAELQRHQQNEIQQEKIDQIRTELLNVSVELRRIISELCPAGLTELGLTHALQGYLARLKRTNSMKLPVIESNLTEGTLDIDIPEPIAICLFRVSQEAIQNVIKHAYATAILLNLQMTHEEITLTIRDNGCGFKVPRPLTTLVQEEHYGLVSMSERVHWSKGTFSVDSAPGIGTVIEVVIPMAGRAE